MKKYLSHIIVALAGLAVGSCGDGKGRDAGEVAEVADVTDFYTEIRDVRRMSFASMKVTKTVTTERTSWYKVGKRIGVYSYDVWLDGVIDLSELTPEDVEVDAEGHTVRVTLPEPRVEIKGRSPEMRTEYEHIDLFRSRPDSRERAELKEIADEDFRRELKDNPALSASLLAQARRKGVAYVSALIEASGYRPVVGFAGDKDLNMGIVE